MTSTLKTMLAGAATVAAVATGTALSASSAQAIDLYPGGFALQAGSNLTATQLTPTSVKLNLSEATFNIVSTSGVFESQLLGPASGNFVADLTLNNTGGNSWSTGPLANFITGLTVDGEVVALDLNASEFIGLFNSPDNFTFAGVGLSSVLRSTASGSVLANTTIASIRLDSTGLTNVQVATVPTPAAVLPGLIGMGTAVFRKKKQEDEGEVTLETAGVRS